MPAITFAEVYQAHSRDIYRFALYLSGDPARADDLTSEAFLRLWTTAAPLQFKTIKHYLLAIVRNLYFEAWRKKQREAPLPDLLSSPHSLERSLADKQELARVLAAIQTLEPTERAALLLRSEHAMSYEDIAATLEIPVVSARVKVHRARQKLIHTRKGN